MQVWILHHQSEPSKGKLPLSGNASGQAGNGWEQPSPQPHPKADLLHDEFQDRANFGSPVMRSWNLHVLVQVCHPGGAGSGESCHLSQALRTEGFYSNFSAAFAVPRLETWQLCSLKPRVMSRTLLPWCRGNNLIYRILTFLYFILRQ